MILRKGDIVELWVDNMAFGGRGIARIDGFVIFVKDGVPGDRILAKTPASHGALLPVDSRVGVPSQVRLMFREIDPR